MKIFVKGLRQFVILEAFVIFVLSGFEQKGLISLSSNLCKNLVYLERKNNFVCMSVQRS